MTALQAGLKAHAERVPPDPDYAARVRASFDRQNRRCG